MILEVDLRPAHAVRPRHSGDGVRVVTLGELARAVKNPPALWPILWARRYAAVTVIESGERPSVTEAVLVLVAGLASTRAIGIEGPAGTRVIGRIRFLVRALGRVEGAVLDELVNSPRLYVVGRRQARHAFDLQRAVSEPRSLVYLRAEPSLRWLGSYVGGSATHTTGVITGFQANGVVPQVVAPERPEGIDGAPFTQVPFHCVHRFAPGLTYVDYSLALRQGTASLRADFVYQRYALGSCAGLELAERLGVPLVLEFNGSELWIERQWGTGTVRLRRLLEAIERRNLIDASLVVVVSKPLGDDVVAGGVPEGRVLVNPNGVDVGGLAPIRARTATEWRDALDLPQAPTVGFIGTFGLWHGVKVLPRMIEELAGRLPAARWVLIGGGDLHDEVAREIERRGLSGHVTLTGVVEHDHAVELLGACDVCVSPHVPNPDGSPFFGSPTKLFEYMGLAKPIVASDLAQIGEVLEDGRTALLCPPGDPVAAAAAVERVLLDPELGQALGDAALEEATGNYSWEAHTRRILAALAH